MVTNLTPKYSWLTCQDMFACKFKILEISSKKWSKTSGKYQPSSEGGTHSPPATPHRLQNPIWPSVGPKMADVVWKGVYP